MEEEVYKRKLKEFFEKDNLLKFCFTSPVSFEDGSYMSRFWYTNRGKIESSSEEICKEILKQYSMYLDMLEERKKEKFKKQCEAFLAMKSYSKFYSAGAKFSDGSAMVNFWEIYKNNILDSNDMVCRGIALQYYRYQKYQKEAIKKQQLELEEKRLKEGTLVGGKYEEFVKANLSKFSKSSGLAFSDGTLMIHWWDKNKGKIIDKEHEPLCQKIMQQYHNYVFENHTTNYVDSYANIIKKKKDGNNE